MRKMFLKPLAAIAVISFTMFSCASSTDTSASTAMDDSTTMSETQTMGGNEQTGTDNTTTTMPGQTGTDAMSSASSFDVSSLSMTNEESLTEMFEKVEDTKQYGLIELAEQSSNLSTFAKLVKAAEIDMVLQQGDSEFTVFAPTNEAFANLPAGNLEHLMKPENKVELRQLLAPHFLGAKVTSAQFTGNQRIGLSDEQEIVIGVTGTGNNNITVGGANIVKPNVEASNGIIHVIDALIQPSAVSPSGVR